MKSISLAIVLASVASLWPMAAWSQAPRHAASYPAMAHDLRLAQAPSSNEPAGTAAPRPAQSALTPADALRLSDLEQQALQNNPALSQARARVQAARGEWEQAGLYPNPVTGYAAEEMGDDGTAGKQGGFIGQEFVTGGKLRLNRAVVSQEIARLQQELAAQRYRVLTDVRARFYETLIAQRAVELTRRLMETAEEGVRAAEALLQAQEGSRVDLLQARVEANNARILYQNAERRRQGAWRRLATVVGTPDMPERPLAGDVETSESTHEWNEALSRLLAESPELAAASAAVQSARWALERARVEWLPNIDVRASIQYNNVNGDDLAGVDVGLPVPLFNRNQGNVRAAEARLLAAQRNMQRVRLSLQDRLAEVFQQYDSARQQVETFRNAILPDAEETLELVRVGYQQGEFGYLSLLTAQRTYFQSNLDYLQALLQLKSAEVQIEGLLLGESLGSAQP